MDEPTLQELMDSAVYCCRAAGHNSLKSRKWIGENYPETFYTIDYLIHEDVRELAPAPLDYYFVDEVVAAAFKLRWG